MAVIVVPASDAEVLQAMMVKTPAQITVTTAGLPENVESFTVVFSDRFSSTDAEEI